MKDEMRHHKHRFAADACGFRPHRRERMDGETSHGRGRPPHRRRGGGRLFDHGGLRWLLLSLTADKADQGPSHGYELIREIETRMGGAYAPSPGVVYPNLTLLEEMGALTSTTEGGRRLYAVTDHGRALLADNAEAVAAVRAVFDKFAARAARPEAIREAIHRLRGAVHARLAGEPALTDAQIAAVAAILNAAADQVEGA